MASLDLINFETTPRNDTELLVAVVLLLIGCILQATMFGEMVSLI